jgi:predicted TIM-barrel fold metal-dependent hydrolase
MIEYKGIKYRVIDAHTHWTNLVSSFTLPFFEVTGLGMPEVKHILKIHLEDVLSHVHNRKERNIALFPHLLDHYGIDQAVVLPIFTFDNTFSAAMQEKFPDRIIGFGFINPIHKHVEKQYNKIRSLVPRLPGIKLHAEFSRFSPIIHKDHLFRLFEFLHQERRIALFHTGSHFNIHDLSPFLSKYPDVPVILGHAGLGSQIDQAIACARVYPNVYLEISGNPYDYLIKKAIQIREIGVERIFYGSDLPSLHPTVEMMKILTLPISEADKQLILGDNLLHLVAKFK